MLRKHPFGLFAVLRLFSGLRSELSGMEKCIPGLGSDVTILTTGRPVHLLVATHAAAVVSPFQAIDIHMKMRLFGLDLEGLRGKRIGQMAALTGDGRLFLETVVAPDTIEIDAAGSGRMVMTDGTILGHIGMHLVIEIDPLIELGENVNPDALRSIHGESGHGQEQTTGDKQRSLEVPWYHSNHSAHISLFNFRLPENSTIQTA
jgi:hypothetical protein